MSDIGFKPTVGLQAQEYRLRHKRASFLVSRRLGKAPSIYILDRVPRSCASGLFPWAATLCFAHARKNMSQHIFRLSNEPVRGAGLRRSAMFSVQERLAQYSSSALSGEEHLRLLVGRDSAVDCLLRHFGSLRALQRASFRELRQFLTRREAEAEIAGLAMSSVVDAEEALAGPLDRAEAVYRANLEMRYLRQEVVHVVLLDAQNCGITSMEVCKGTVDEPFAHPREIFRPVIVHAAASFVLVHNLWAATHRLCWTKPQSGMQ